MYRNKSRKEWYEERRNIHYDDWRGNIEKHDFFLTDMDIAKNVSLEAMIIFSVVESGMVSSVSEVANVLNIGNSRVSSHLSKLEDAGYVVSWNTNQSIQSEAKSQEDIKLIMKNKEKQICEWCNAETLIIEEHHYPIPQRFGGTEVVAICKNCHVSFHQTEVEENGGWNNVKKHSKGK